MKGNDKKKQIHIAKNAIDMIFTFSINNLHYDIRSIKSKFNNNQ